MITTVNEQGTNKSLLDKFNEQQADQQKLREEARSRLSASSGTGNLGNDLGLLSNTIDAGNLTSSNLVKLLAQQQEIEQAIAEEKASQEFKSSESEKDRQLQRELAGASAQQKQQEEAKKDITLAKTPQEIAGVIGLAAKSKIAETASLLKDLQSIQSRLTDTGFFGSKVTGQTGLIAQLAGATGEQGQLRQDIEKFSQNVKNKTYGSALSEAEIKESKKWLPLTSKQENENIKRIISISNSKMNEITSQLRTQGLSDEQIQTYLESFGLGGNTQVNEVSTTSGSKYKIEEE